jgi:hypothetical protein
MLSSRPPVARREFFESCDDFSDSDPVRRYPGSFKLVCNNGILSRTASCSRSSLFSPWPLKSMTHCVYFGIVPHGGEGDWAGGNRGQGPPTGTAWGVVPPPLSQSPPPSQGFLTDCFAREPVRGALAVTNLYQTVKYITRFKV